ncbi:response regulator transcription factor [Collinsella sp. zg1085]|uniref:response regulator transcription factor n=1 Tax=Collinsella sp. zg1085 TaxID=2844380 RepID=UPI001C0B8F7A|nr:response regulator transcription factor [Collinsella sp. zg1085]QWT17987.1 response regulator transcription factor [Collinsella sp. zg1085]
MDSLDNPLIFIVEDNVAIREELMLALSRHHFRVYACTSFNRVVDEILEQQPALVLLDLTLPGTDGQFICRELREQSQIPLIVLTSRVTEIDEVMSMNLGADDFIAKPYSTRVLVARIQALLRRSASVEPMLVSHKGVQLDPARSLALAGDKQVELTKNEMRILSLLISRAGTIVARETIMRDLWDSEAFIDDNTLTVNVNRLRATLEKIGVVDYLTTHRGRGYSV